ncbi:MAG: hypothetical protein MJZ66_08860 [Bacteroidales bacterium]|nr:hypothetical protein [Bacteroidales bacterium]
MRNTSVLFCLLGLMFLMTGFVGFMAHTFSNSTSELNGIRLAKSENVAKELQSNDRVCFVSQVYADDAIEMPDNHQKVIKGSLCLYALWPDGSKSIILNWNRKANYIRVAESDTTPGSAIVPQTVECISDTASTASRLRIIRTHNSVTVEYFQTRSKLDGCYSKGQPQIILERDILENGAQAAITVARPDGTGASPSVQSVVPYSKAIARDSGISKAKTFYLILAALGIAMFFVPETKTINTITNIKLIGSKIIQKQM